MSFSPNSSFEELLGQVGGIKYQQMRACEKDYCEVVVEKAQLASMLSVLNIYFGTPLKPEGQSPSPEAQRFSQPYGGVMGNQTLYHRKNETSSEMALLWPWGSGLAVTVKIIRTS